MGRQNYYIYDRQGNLLAQAINFDASLECIMMLVDQDPNLQWYTMYDGEVIATNYMQATQQNETFKEASRRNRAEQNKRVLSSIPKAAPKPLPQNVIQLRRKA